MERAWDEGLAVVTSAGNGGPDSDSLDSPAYDPYVIAVGAEDSGGTATIADDGMALFSSRGSVTRGPDVVAPGVAIVSTRVPGSFLDEAFPDARIGDGFRGSGTSQAAAVVSGAAALLIGERSRLAPDEVKALLRSSGRPLPVTETSLQGTGVVDVARRFTPAVPANAGQSFTKARIGGWVRGTLRNQYAVENRRLAERESLDRQSLDGQSLGRQPLDGQSLDRQPLDGQSLDGQPLDRQPLDRQPLGERRMGRGFVMSGRKWNPSV